MDPSSKPCPCPGRIIQKARDAFYLGAVGGGAWHFLKGAAHAPKGSRIIGATQALCVNAPRVAGHFALWDGLYTLADCSLASLRRKEDRWNAILAGAFTSGVMSMRQGFWAASRSVIVGGALVMIAEGSLVLLQEIAPPPQPVPVIVDEHPPAMGKGGVAPGVLTASSLVPPRTAGASTASAVSPSSWFGGWSKQCKIK